MGSLVKHGTGDSAVYTYSPIGRDSAYERAPTSALLLLAVQAMRLVWRERGYKATAGVRELWRTAVAIARGRRAPLTDQEMGALRKRLPRDRRRRRDGASIKIVAGGGAALEHSDAGALSRSLAFLLWDYHKRWSDSPWDNYAKSVTRYLGELAMALRDRPDAALERLRDLEIACLVHHWTNTGDVVPRRIVQALVGASSLANAEALARAWRTGPARPALPRYEDQPEVIAKREAEEARRQAAADAEAARQASLTPEQRAAEQAAAERIRLSVEGLIRRTVA